MWIVINGERRQFFDGLSLSKLIEQLQLPASRIAVELNGEVVRRINWPATSLQNDDRIEIVHFVGGGVF
ncbi:MAG: sulfur carrier protein ThiS [Pyrinomonadaceae bacterium]